MVKAPAKGQRSIRTESSMQGASMTAAGSTTQGTSASLVATFDGKGVGLVATGAWIAERTAELEKIVDDAAGRYQTARSIDIDLARLDRLDTFGAWLIERLNRARRLDPHHRSVRQRSRLDGRGAAGEPNRRPRYRRGE